VRPPARPPALREKRREVRGSRIADRVRAPRHNRERAKCAPPIHALAFLHALCSLCMQSASCMRTFHVVRRLGLSLLASSSSSSQRSMTTAPLNVMQPAAAAAAAAADDRPPPLYQPEVLSLEEWSLRADSYLERAKELTGGRRSERQHPIYNFIYNYYAWKPSVLIDTWSPGSGVILQGGGSADGRLPMRYFERLADGSGGFYSASCLSAKRVKALRWVRNFLAASGSRAPHFNCFGLHEWAMLFHPPNGSGEVSRHQDLPLRVNMSQLNAVVESVPMACTHFDAFRFFSPEARPLNSKMLTRQVL
jgi:hypothetical protein